MSESPPKKSVKPVVGITLGDINGIGPEVTIKALMDNRVTRFLTPVIYADGGVVGFFRKQMDLQNFNYNQIRSLDKLVPRKINIIGISDQKIEAQPGIPTEESGQYAVLALKRCLEDLKQGKIDAMCTGPISKENVQSEQFNFPGHTEFLAKEAGVPDNLMILVNEDLRVAVLTGHIPLKEVPVKLNKDLLRTKLNLFLKSLKKDFGIKKPRLAVLGLNPHAGENGLLGSEEQDMIIPVIKEMKEAGHLVFGPFPSDGFFGNLSYNGFDGIMAMYHDQGLTPFKAIAFSSGVNFTGGLPFIRTSPDHGTAFSLAGKGTADEASMRNAILMAAELFERRQTD